MAENSALKTYDLDRNLHGGVREIICEVVHYIRLKGWDLVEGPRVISPGECEIKVYHTLFGEPYRARGLQLFFAHKINVKTVAKPTPELPSNEYYCVEVSDLSDESGVGKTIFCYWSTIMIIPKVVEIFHELKQRETSQMGRSGGA